MTAPYCEKFKAGRTIEHEKRRTISESDNQHSYDMTMNQQLLHLDAEFTADSQFGKRLVNGLYTMNLAVGLSVPDTTDGITVMNLGYDDVSHLNPMFHGDTLRAQTIVFDKRETSDGGRGAVTMEAETFNQDDNLVCEFERAALSLRRKFAADADDA